MLKVWHAAAIVAASATVANAGGIDRSKQSISPLFEEGSYAEFSIGSVNPEISGSIAGLSSGDMVGSYIQAGAAYKRDINDRFSFAVIYDRPYGADVAYPTGVTYPFTGATAELRAHALSAVLRYKFDNGVSLHGGLRAQTLEAEIEIPTLPPTPYSAVGDRDTGTGYLIGAAYEKPEIALRIAVTYFSEVEHNLETTENYAFGAGRSSTTTVDTPEAVNIDFQTGIAANTLLFGGVRWVDWSSFEIAPADYTTAIGNPLLSYLNDTYTYTLGVGRKLNDNWSVSAALSYEKHQDVNFTNLGPKDGLLGITLGARYTKDNMVISGGINYTDIGNANTTVPGLGSTSFTGNSAIGVGVKVGYRF